LDSVHKGTEGDTIIPICSEVPYLLVRDLGVDPGQHSTLGGEALPCAADLEVTDEAPYQTQDEFQLTIVDVLGACKGKELVIFVLSVSH